MHRALDEVVVALVAGQRRDGTHSRGPDSGTAAAAHGDETCGEEHGQREGELGPADMLARRKTLMEVTRYQTQNLMNKEACATNSASIN